MVKNREQLTQKIISILSEEQYKERMDKVKEDLVHTFAEDIAKNFIAPRVTEEEIREEINASLDDYFIENSNTENDQESVSGVNFQVELGNELMKLIEDIPVGEEWKNKIYRIAIGFNNFGLYQSMQKECIVSAMYDLCGLETGNFVMCEATKRTGMMTEKMFNENFNAEKQNHDEVLDKRENKVIQFTTKGDRT